MAKKSKEPTLPVVDVIDSFQDEYRFLSNFWEAPIPWKGVIFQSVEAAYQASKTDNYEIFKAFADMTPGQAKREGRKIHIRSDWEEVKLWIMEELLHMKFNIHDDLRKKLIQTGQAQLIEGNTWGDTYWGQVNGKGQNHLGRLLMEVRSELKPGK